MINKIDHDLIILAGGMGSRLNYINKKKLPNSLIKFSNFNLLDYILMKYSKYTFRKIYILTSYKKYLLKKYKSKFINFQNIEIIFQKKLIGSGGSLLNLKKKISDKFIVVNGDMYFDIDIHDFIKRSENKLCSIALSNSNKYSTKNKFKYLDCDSQDKLFFNNKSKYFNGGIYFINKKLFQFFPKGYSSLKNDILKKLIDKKLIYGKKYNDFFIDIKKKKNLLYAKKNFKKIFTKPAIFLDRDGVINYDTGYVHKFNKFKFRKTIIKALKYASLKNCYIFIVTNQAGIGRNIFKLSDFQKLHLNLKKYFINKNIKIDDVRFCPFHPDAKIIKYKKHSGFRKPGNLMIKSIQKAWPINMKKSFMIGDQKADEICANKSNLNFEYVSVNTYKQLKRLIKKFIE